MPLLTLSRITDVYPVKAVLRQSLGGAIFMGLCIWGLEYSNQATSHGWVVFAAVVIAMCACIVVAVRLIWGMVRNAPARIEERIHE